MNHFFKLIIVIVVLHLAAIPAIGTIIFDNGEPIAFEALASSNLNEGTQIQEAGDNFVLQPGANVITDIHWGGLYFKDHNIAAPPDQDDFIIRIFDIVSGVPEINASYENPVGHVSRTLSTINLNWDVYEYTLLIEPLSLTPGAEYLLSIFNNTDDDLIWAWNSHSAYEGTDWFRLSNGDAWENYNGTLAFNLTGPTAPIPEPGTMLLLGSGLFGLGAFRKKFRKK